MDARSWIFRGPTAVPCSGVEPEISVRKAGTVTKYLGGRPLAEDLLKSIEHVY